MGKGPMAPTTVTTVCIRWTHVPVQPQLLSSVVVTAWPHSQLPNCKHTETDCLRAEVTLAYLRERDTGEDMLNPTVKDVDVNVRGDQWTQSQSGSVHTYPQNHMIFFFCYWIHMSATKKTAWDFLTDPYRFIITETWKNIFKIPSSQVFMLLVYLSI